MNSNRKYSSEYERRESDGRLRWINRIGGESTTGLPDHEEIQKAPVYGEKFRKRFKNLFGEQNFRWQ